MELTQEGLAEKIGVSTSFIGHIERGSRKLSVETLYSLCVALDVSADFLIGI
ncbi:MAG: helix-turn-helix transcriptional regulator [Oscillospiraceae bacterium]|nr:helix-turn-helix transcriptional regulator [Oscillospiraceae bacterium]